GSAVDTLPPMCFVGCLQSLIDMANRTLTTLPPAVPGGNSSDSCAFPDRNGLIDRVASDWQGYNISLLVATCPGVCAYIYGSGNPDISGIGVCMLFCLRGWEKKRCDDAFQAMISYYIQGIVAFVLGPPLALLALLLDRN